MHIFLLRQYEKWQKTKKKCELSFVLNVSVRLIQWQGQGRALMLNDAEKN